MSKPGRLKILFCIDNLARGGTELQLTGLIDRLDRDLYEPYLLTIRASDAALDPPACERLKFDFNRLFSPSGFAAISKLTRWLRTEKIDVVQTYFLDAAALGGIAARLAGTPVRVMNFRDMGFWQTGSRMLVQKRIYPMFTHMIANSATVRDHFVQSAGLNPNRFSVIYNGLEIDGLSFVAHDGPTVDVGIVGNLNRRVKRTDLFIAAAGILAPRFPEVRWHIIGDGEMRKQFETQAAEAGLGAQVVFTGRIDDVPAYLEQLGIGVICSDSEGFSNALIEYMAKGCAVVATDVGGNPEAITAGETGLLVPPDDAGALAKAIGSLLSDSERRQKLAHAARQSVENAYIWQRCLDAHASIFSSRAR